jgi:biopolymer transport protein TolR
MGIALGGANGEVVAAVNVVPLIDILLVLLVILMIIPHHQQGLDAALPDPSPSAIDDPRVVAVVVQVLADGSLRLNQVPVTWNALPSRLGEIFRSAAARRIAFVRGESPVEFAAVARVVDAMQSAGVTTVGLLTRELEKGQ